MLDLNLIFNESNDEMQKEEAKLNEGLETDHLLDDEEEYLRENPITESEISERIDEITLLHFRINSRKYIILTFLAFVILILSIYDHYPLFVIALETISLLSYLCTLLIGFGYIKCKRRKLKYRILAIMGLLFFVGAALVYSKIKL